MPSAIARLIFVLLLTCGLAAAQTTGPTRPSPGSGSGGGSTGTGTTPTPTTTVPSPSRTIPPIQPPTMPQTPIMLTGRVVMDDGTPPPPTERISIERVCNGRTVKEGHTDSRGYFSITIGNENTVFQDASSDGSGIPGLNSMGSPGGTSTGGAFGQPGGGISLMGCELRAVMSGALSSYIELSTHRQMDDPNVGIITLTRVGKVEGETVSVTSLQAPKEARKAFDRGRKEMRKKKPEVDKAKAEFLHAVQVDPSYAEAWNGLAEVYYDGKDFDNAVDACQKAIAADSHYVNPYFTMIQVAAMRQQWKATADYSDRLIGLDAYHFPAAYFYNALAYLRLGNLDKAQVSIQAARKYDLHSALPKILLLMGDILMRRSDYAGAAQAYRAFLQRVPQGDAADAARAALEQAQTRLAAVQPPPK